MIRVDKEVGVIKKKTHDEYVNELAVKNPNVEVVGKYIDANTKIMHCCLIHNIYWKFKPASALQGCGCKICKKEKFKKSKTKNHEQYVNEVKKINPHIKVIGTYSDAKTPIEHFCEKHNIFWYPLPTNVLKGNGCVECGKEKIRSKNRRTHIEYIEELKTVNPNIICLEKYMGANTPILHKCKIDGYEWKAIPEGIICGKKCPKCIGNLKKTHDKYIKELGITNSDIEVIGKYVNSYTPILHKCKIDGYEWLVCPSSILSGTGCPKCAGNIRLTHEEYVKELQEYNPDLEAIGKYVNMKTSILHRCLIHNYEWNVFPSVALAGCGCPKCNESRGEKQIRLWLEKNNIRYTFQHSFEDCCDIKPLPFDFYLLNKNICIEYDGKQHFEPIDYFGGEDRFKYQIKHDNIKNEYCKNNGISLLRIPYYKNVEEELNNFLFI